MFIVCPNIGWISFGQVDTPDKRKKSFAPRLRNSGNPKLANSRFVSFIDKVSKAHDPTSQPQHLVLIILGMFGIQALRNFGKRSRQVIQK